MWRNLLLICVHSEGFLIPLVPDIAMSPPSNLAFEGSLIAEIFTPPEAQEVLAILESPPNPVILKHQGVTAYASVTIFGKGGQGVYSVQRKCAAAAVAMTQVKRLQMQMQNDLEGMMTSCHQSIQDLEFHQLIC